MRIIDKMSSKRNKVRGKVTLSGSTPFSENVATNIGKEFFALFARHFPTSSRLHNICNKQNVKLSYSCMPNKQSIISQHDKRILNQMPSSAIETPSCN